VIAAHWLAYRIVTPDPHVRAELLESSGHRFFTLVAAAAVGGFALAVGGSLAGRQAKIETRAHASCRMAARLALSQAVAWVVLEGVERALAAHHHGSLFAEPVFWVGLALQVALAACSALLFTSVGRAVLTLLARRRERASRRPAARWPAARLTPLRAVRLEGTWGSRGPPVVWAS
jgi:hypothetical protein